jgi:hypothetical protein
MHTGMLEGVNVIFYKVEAFDMEAYFLLDPA